jgi:hypothetical protein
LVEQVFDNVLRMSEDVANVRAKIEMRLQTARMQWKRMPPASPSRGHAGGLVAGLEEALALLGPQAK